MRCACHGSLFALATGEPLEGPATSRYDSASRIATGAWWRTSRGDGDAIVVNSLELLDSRA